MSFTAQFRRRTEALLTKVRSRTFHDPIGISAGGLRVGLVAALGLSLSAAQAGTWTAVTAAPGGVTQILLLSDGTVIGQNGGNAGWYKLTPNLQGSYTSGTWSTIASMHDTRLYGASAVTPDGHVFIAGGEYGTGGSTAESYDPIANSWTMAPASGQGFSDSISTILPNGNVLIGPVSPSVSGGTVIWNYQTNTWTQGPTYVRGGYQDEASWVKLPDDSVLTIDPFGTNSERYIPSANHWIDDGIVPTNMYDGNGELGAAVLLPNGKAFFMGGTGHTALYTPTGNTNPGSWAAGPTMPNSLGTSDAPAAMMYNGTLLCAMGPAGTLNGPTTFTEYNYTTNAFTTITGPTGATDNVQPWNTRMLDLPDGGVLYSNGGSQLYEYKPTGATLAAARPTISSVLKNQDGTYAITGYLLTGISEGAEYGDDAQMATNFPIVRFTASNGNVYFGRSTNWSTTGVMKGGAIESAKFTTPASMPAGTYQLQVITNGVASYPAPFDSTFIYNYVGNENSTFSFGTPADLAFGASGSYAYKYAKTGNITYNTATFGDPLYGSAKFGFYKWFTQSVAENNTATFTLPVEAAYGGNGNFLYKYGVSGTVTFSNTAFGGDPAPNVAKNGFYMPYTQCAAENETLSFNIPTDLAYGANGHYNFLHAFTGTVTFNNATFGDPVSGTAKAGYFRPSH